MKRSDQPSLRAFDFPRLLGRRMNDARSRHRMSYPVQATNDEGRATAISLTDSVSHQRLFAYHQPRTWPAPFTWALTTCALRLPLGRHVALVVTVALLVAMEGAQPNSHEWGLNADTNRYQSPGNCWSTLTTTASLWRQPNQRLARRALPPPAIPWHPASKSPEVPKRRIPLPCPVPARLHQQAVSGASGQHGCSEGLVCSNHDLTQHSATDRSATEARFTHCRHTEDLCAVRKDL